ncbi:MAG: signal peptidase I [Pseudopedobacter sp.]|nr:signal peptidase I [Deinococcales bacterium]
MTDIENPTGADKPGIAPGNQAGAPESFGRKLWREVIKPYGEAILFAVVITTFLFTLVAVDGTSMMPNLRTGERVFIPKYETWLHRVGIGSFQRGDILVFKPPGDAGDRVSFLGLWNYTPFLIKRLIGLPGDKIRIDKGVVFLNDKQLDQSFTTDYWKKRGCWETDGNYANNVDFNNNDGRSLTVPAGQYFMMGDNRNVGGSQDSRFFGTVPMNNVSGRATFVLWPFVRQTEADYTCDSNSKTSVKLSGENVGNWRILQRPDGFKALEGTTP